MGQHWWDSLSVQTKVYATALFGGITAAFISSLLFEIFSRR
jgi:hypothetical protein